MTHDLSNEKHNCLICTGPDFGYFPNASKTCLIVKSLQGQGVQDLSDNGGIVILGYQIVVVVCWVGVSAGGKYLS